MKIVLDTNVLIAGFITHGTCNELIEYCALNHEVVISRFILGEFTGKLTNKFGFTMHEAETAAALLESRFEVVIPQVPDKPICRDPDDDKVIGIALTGSCTCIVTGDKDLLALAERYLNIVTPAEFWRRHGG